MGINNQSSSFVFYPIIQDAIDNNSEIFNDFRLKSYMIKGLSDKYSEIVNLATKQLKKHNQINKE